MQDLSNQNSPFLKSPLRCLILLLLAMLALNAALNGLLNWYWPNHRLLSRSINISLMNIGATERSWTPGTSSHPATAATSSTPRATNWSRPDSPTSGTRTRARVKTSMKSSFTLVMVVVLQFPRKMTHQDSADHAMLETPVPTRTLSLSNIGPG